MSIDHPFGHMVHEALVRQVRELYERRAKERAQIRTKSQVLALRRSLRRRLRRCFGPFPNRTPLDPVVTGVVKRKHYTIEKVIYHSRPHFPVTANLYLPKGIDEPRPAVLAACGHSQNGKACDLYQAFSNHLAKQGYVVLIYDPISQGERYQYLKKEGTIQPQGCCQEHNMAGNQMLLCGEFFGMWRTWDGIRGLDYLLSRPEVDRTRVGVTGNSGGGTLTTYLNALDDRFTMAAPGCFVTQYLSNLENELPADSEQIPPGILAAGLDLADFFVAQIPRPTILLGQNNDFFDKRGLIAAYEEIKKLYRILGAEENVALHIGPTDHGYTVHNREAMYNFFNKQAGVRSAGKEKGSMRVEKEETLWATPEGQVQKIGGKRVWTFTKRKANRLAELRDPMGRKRLKAAVTRQLVLPKRQGTPHYRVLRHMSVGQSTRHSKSCFAVETEPGLLALLHVFTQGEAFFHLPKGKDTTLYVPHLSSVDDVVDGLAPGTRPLFAVDVRGIGMLRVRTCDDENFFSPYGSDYFYSSYYDMLGQSYLGKRVHDLLCVLDLLQDYGYSKIRIVGRGMGALLATHGALLHKAVKDVVLMNALLSYNELTQVPVQSWPLSCLSPGVLQSFDLPDCLRAIDQEKSLKLIAPWNSQMRPWRRNALKTHLKGLGLGHLSVTS